MFLRYSAEKGAVAVGAERSITQRCRFDIVPELVACDAVAGSLRCRPVCFVMVTFVACERDGLRTLGPSDMPSSTFSSASCRYFSSRAGTRSLECASDPVCVCNFSDWFCSCVCAVLRALNENFFGGLKELRVVCNFSDSPLIVYKSQQQSLNQVHACDTRLYDR